MDEEIKKVIKKTGTSILGIVCKDGIVMAADRQVTAGNIVMSKTERKIIQINDYLVIATCGNVSDAQFMAKILSAELKLKEYNSGERPTVKEAANLLSMIAFRSIRQFSTIPSVVGILIGGYNEDGSFELYTIEPAGSILKVEDYDANFGSGMPYILGILESEYKKDITTKEGIELAVKCLKASTQRDVGSGYGIDIFTITKNEIKKVFEKEIIAELK
ncbi:MAG: proteasome subunit beta [Candidatus Pacearchaeota archaeon]